MKHKKYAEGIYENMLAGKMTKEKFLEVLETWLNEEIEFGGAKVIEEAEEEAKDLPGQEKLF